MSDAHPPEPPAGGTPPPPPPSSGATPPPPPSPGVTPPPPPSGGQFAAPPGGGTPPPAPPAGGTPPPPPGGMPPTAPPGQFGTTPPPPPGQFGTAPPPPPGSGFQNPAPPAGQYGGQPPAPGAQAFPPPGGYAQAPMAAGMQGTSANFGQRLVAYIIDIVIIVIAQVILTTIFGDFGQILSFLVGLGYFGYMEGEMGATFGKQVMNIKVIDQNTGGNLGIGKALLRYVGRIASGIVCLLGYFWMLWDSKQQTWHDKIAGSRVVTTS